MFLQKHAFEEPLQTGKTAKYADLMQTRKSQTLAFSLKGSGFFMGPCVWLGIGPIEKLQTQTAQEGIQNVPHKYQGRP